MKNKFPLMKNNILRDDLNKVIKHLRKKDPILTQSKNVKKFESLWSKWLGVKYSVFVNSGSSANLITFSVLKEKFGIGEVIVPTLTWVSDIVAIIRNGFKPVFVDINLSTLSMNNDEIIKKINNKTKAVFLTHAQGFNGLSRKLINYLKKKNISLIEDVCESHGARFLNKKLGSYGLISNFSFYYAHHLSTIEGGMISTNNKDIYEMSRMFRSHGMVREVEDKKLKNKIINKYSSLNPDFIFNYAGYNLRSTEINAILGINQIKRLNKEIFKRNENFRLFLSKLDKRKFFTEFKLEGISNYALNIILRYPDKKLCNRLQNIMKKNGIEFRRGSAGGGNQLRQPYLKKFTKSEKLSKYPNVEHVHFFGFYIGNYPNLGKNDIIKICNILNSA